MDPKTQMNEEEKKAMGFVDELEALNLADASLADKPATRPEPLKDLSMAARESNPEWQKWKAEQDALMTPENPLPVLSSEELKTREEEAKLQEIEGRAQKFASGKPVLDTNFVTQSPSLVPVAPSDLEAQRAMEIRNQREEEKRRRFGLTEEGPSPASGDPSDGMFSSAMGSINKQEAILLRANELDTLKLQNESRLIDASIKTQEEVHQRQMETFAERNRVLGNITTKIEEADEYAQKMTRLDPNKFWNDMGTGRQILAGIGIFLGGLGRGPNEALGIIQKAIDRDIDAQKDAYLRARDKGQSLRNLYSTMREKFSSDFEATEAARTFAMRDVEQKIAQVGRTYQGPIQKQKIMQLMEAQRGNTSQQADKLKMTMMGELMKRQSEQAKKQGELFIPALGKTAQTPDDAKIVKKLTAAFPDLLDKIDRAIAHREKYGAEIVNREAIAVGKSIMSDIYTTINSPEFKNLGALSGPDLELIKQSAGGDLDSIGNVMASLENLKSTIKGSYNAKLRAYGLKDNFSSFKENK